MRRRHALALSVITPGPLVILLAPDRFIRWSEHRAAILRAMREAFALPAREVLAIEGLAGSPDEPSDGAGFLDRCREAAAGAVEVLPRFHLFAWDEAAQAYRLARAPTG